jgi:DNA topoisomerase VI subunit B
MANQPASDIYAGRFSVPSVDFAGLVAMSRNTLTETAKQNSKLYTTLQAVGKEWTEFVSARLREESQLLQTLLECKELPNMQRAYMEFWRKALSQYEEETQRLMRIAQGAMEEEAVQVAQERAVHVAQESVQVTSGNAHGGRAPNSSTRPQR